MAGRARPVVLAGEQVLPVLSPLQSLFPEGGLRRGTTVVVQAADRKVLRNDSMPSFRSTLGAGAGAGGAGTGAGAGAGAGVTSLTLAVAVAASQAGSWCAAVGLPALGMVAAAGLGMALERFALVPTPGSQWPAVTAALVDAVDLILIRPVAGTRSTDARRLMARARERGVVLVVSGMGWPEPADLSLSVAPDGWQGLGQGHGYLQARAVAVTSGGRRAASRPRQVQLWLPGDQGAVAARKVESSPRQERPEAAVSAAG